MSWAVTAVSVGTGLYGAYESKRAGDRAEIHSREEADRIYELATRNNELKLGAAEYNASITRQIAGANAGAVIRNAHRNAELMTLEYEEELRRHIRGEKILAGNIRAGSAASGISVNEGTPLLYLSNELDEAERERKWIEKRGTLTVFNYLAQESERASIISLTGELNAQAIMFNAETEAEIYLNEQLGLANATRDQGQSAYRQSRSDAYLTLFNTGITTGVRVAEKWPNSLSRSYKKSNLAVDTNAPGFGRNDYVA